MPCVNRAVVLGQHLPVAPVLPARSTKTFVRIHESFEDARTVVYQPPIGLQEGGYTIVPLADYEARANRLARMRVALAGIRLAEVLNRELK
jgi:hypothetical protein